MARAPKPTVIPDINANDNATPTLLSSIEIIESLKEEMREIAERIRDEKKAIKDMGFDSKIVNKVLARRARDKDELAEEDALIETYEVALEAASFKRDKPAKAKVN